MLEKIKNQLLSFYDKTDKLWLFFSLFDANNNLLVSNGVLATDKVLPELIDILYHAILEKFEQQTSVIVIDVVKEIQLQANIQNLLTLSPKDHGIFMINRQSNISGVVLPNTEWVNDIKAALALLKSKYKLSGNVEISSFTTRRVAFSK